MSASEPLDFPLEMGLSLLLLAGYLLRPSFGTAKLGLYRIVADGRWVAGPGPQ